MSSGPIRLHDTAASELADLREAIRQARDLGPDAAWLERMRETVDEALDRADPPDPALQKDAEASAREREPIEPDDTPHRIDTTMTTEASSGVRAPEPMEAEVAGDLAAGLLVAGAAVAWLVRRTPNPPDEHD